MFLSHMSLLLDICIAVQYATIVARSALTKHVQDRSLHSDYVTIS